MWHARFIIFIWKLSWNKSKDFHLRIYLLFACWVRVRTVNANELCPLLCSCQRVCVLCACFSSEVSSQTLSVATTKKHSIWIRCCVVLFWVEFFSGERNDYSDPRIGNKNKHSQLTWTQHMSEHARGLPYRGIWPFFVCVETTARHCEYIKVYCLLPLFCVCFCSNEWVWPDK